MEQKMERILELGVKKGALKDAVIWVTQDLSVPTFTDLHKIGPTLIPSRI